MHDAESDINNSIERVLYLLDHRNSEKTDGTPAQSSWIRFDCGWNERLNARKKLISRGSDPE